SPPSHHSRATTAWIVVFTCGMIGCGVRTSTKAFPLAVDSFFHRVMLQQGLRLWLWQLLALVFIVECGCNNDLDLGAIPPFTHVYVANLGSHTVSVIDLKSFRNVNTIAVGKAPGRLAASPIADLLFPAN